jgi:glutamyl-tRNA synthetase
MKVSTFRASTSELTCSGVGVGGSKGPYVQSERLDLYRQSAQQLLDQDQAYECFCSPSELQAIRQGLLKQGHRHAYDGRCRHLSEEDRGRRKRAGHKYVVRYKVGLADQAQESDVPY